MYVAIQQLGCRMTDKKPLPMALVHGKSWI